MSDIMTPQSYIFQINFKERYQEAFQQYFMDTFYPGVVKASDLVSEQEDG